MFSNKSYFNDFFNLHINDFSIDLIINKLENNESNIFKLTLFNFNKIKKLFNVCSIRIKLNNYISLYYKTVDIDIMNKNIILILYEDIVLLDFFYKKQHTYIETLYGEYDYVFEKSGSTDYDIITINLYLNV